MQGIMNGVKRLLGRPVEGLQPDAGANMPTMPENALAPVKRAIGKQEIDKAFGILQKYKAAKAPIESRVVENDRFWRLRHAEAITATTRPEVKSAWLLNAVLNKHADALDNTPMPNVLPREEGDRGTAKTLASVLPAILELNEFDGVYADMWWDKLMGGTGIYGVVWDQQKLNGLGDVGIRRIDILNVFWEPDIMDIQKSRNFFHVELWANEVAERTYPQLKGKAGKNAFTLARYDDASNTDLSDHCHMIDWYYKKQIEGKTLLHYCKFCNGVVLYASEDDPKYAQTGFYAHGKYPFVFDVMFPIKNTPVGFGYIDIGRSPQSTIDRIGASMAKSAEMSARKRWFVRQDGTVNEQEYADWEKEFVHVAGSLDENALKEIQVSPPSAAVASYQQTLVDELKDTLGNRDFSTGGTTGGVTAMGAILALQESGSKLSRDMLKSTYRACSSVYYMVLEVVRQFYDLPRTFRITNDTGSEEFVSFDNTGMVMQPRGTYGNWLPVFDIKVKPQKSNPYSREAQNQMALEFFKMGFFNPQMVDQAMPALKMMEFDGIEQVRQMVSQNGDMYQRIRMAMQMVMDMDAKSGMQYGAMLGQILMPALQAGMPAQGGALPQVGALGGNQDANERKEKVREEVAGASDPNGGTA